MFISGAEAIIKKMLYNESVEDMDESKWIFCCLAEVFFSGYEKNHNFFCFGWGIMLISNLETCFDNVFKLKRSLNVWN